MNLYVVRHGQTDWNINHMILSKTDIELNETGKKQAEEVAKKIEKEKIDLIISSPLKRTMQTADIINRKKNVSIIYDARIQERNFGEFEGLKDDNSKFNIHEFWDYEKNIQYEQAEDVRDFFERIITFLEFIKKEYKNSNVLLVTHGAVSGVMNCYLTKQPKKLDVLLNGMLGNCEYVKYEL